MKYKNIPSMAHNLAHSFLSYMNYVDDGYVVDDLRQLARQAGGERISVDWLAQGPHLPESWPKRVQRSISYYHDWLQKHSANHEVDLARLRSLRTELYMTASHQIRAQYIAIDDRGREYRGPVKF